MTSGPSATYQITQSAAPAGDTKADAAKKAIDNESKKQGRTSTILTSGGGASGTAPTAKKTLLGQ